MRKDWNWASNKHCLSSRPTHLCVCLSFLQGTCVLSTAGQNLPQRPLTAELKAGETEKNERKGETEWWKDDNEWHTVSKDWIKPWYQKTHYFILCMPITHSVLFIPIEMCWIFCMSVLFPLLRILGNLICCMSSMSISSIYVYVYCI